MRKTSRSGWWEVNSRRMRRVLRTMAAPIFKSLTRMVAAHARASSVPFKASARKRSMSVYASAANSSRNWLAANL